MASATPLLICKLWTWNSDVSRALSHGLQASLQGASSLCPTLCCSPTKPPPIPGQTFNELSTVAHAGPKTHSELSFFHDVIQALLSI